MSRAKAFAPPSYLLRHGSPDKVPASPFAELGELLEVVCPSCKATICVDVTLLPSCPEFECAGCRAEIVLLEDGTVRREARARRRALGEA